ncbi:MAG: hypothetical protein MH204_08290 [Fimbriimonadaceae bacterium]|nr:hypothetical protein [Fimbriimonadaceae bacterium]
MSQSERQASLLIAAIGVALSLFGALVTAGIVVGSLTQRVQTLETSGLQDRAETREVVREIKATISQVDERTRANKEMLARISAILEQGRDGSGR